MVGGGAIARDAHIPSLSGFDDVEIVAVCDRSEEAVREAAERYGISRFFGDYEQMLAETKPDCVYVLIPPQYTYDVVTACLEIGADVFLEKPPGMTAEQTRNMARLAKEKNCVAMVGFNRRFIPCLAETKRRVEEIGRVNQCTAIYHKGMLDQPQYFRGAADFMAADVVHAVDALRWICGEAERVASSIQTHGKPYAMGFNALIEFRDGVVGHLCSNFAAGSRIHIFHIHAAGISGLVNVSAMGEGNEAYLYTERGVEKVRVDGLEGKTRYHEVYGFDQENRHFLESVRGRTQPLTSLEDSVKTMELAEWIFRAQMGGTFYVR